MNVLSDYFSGVGRIAKCSLFFRIFVASAYAIAFGMLAQTFVGNFGAAIAAAVFLRSLGAICVKRLHDTGESGKWLFLMLLPVIGPIWLFAKLLRSGSPGANRYGTDPSNRMGYLKVDISK